MGKTITHIIINTILFIILYVLSFPKVIFTETFDNNNTNEIKGKNSEKASSFFQIGLAYEKLDDIDEAIRFYQKALSIDFNMMDTRLRLGALYIKNKRFQKALEQYKIIADHGVDQYIISLFLFNLAVGLFQDKQYSQAEKHFKIVRSSRADKSIIRSSLKFLQALDRKKEEERWWKLSVRSTFQLDDNVKLEPEEISSGKKSNVAIVEVNGSVIPFRRKSWNIGGDYHFYKNFHFYGNEEGIDQFDLTAHDLKLKTVYNRNTNIFPFRFTLVYNYDISSLKTQKYSQFNLVGINVERMEHFENLTRFRYYFKSQEFFSDHQRDSGNHCLSFNHFILFGEGQRKVGLNITYSRNITEAVDFDYYGIMGGVDFYSPLIFNTNTGMGAEYNFKDFSKHPLKRRDNIFRYKIYFEKEVYTHFSINVQYKFIKNISDKDYRYQRNIISLIITYNLNYS